MASETVIAQRYILKSELGAGGMGVVYHAYDRLTRQEVALKRVQFTARQAKQAIFGSNSALPTHRRALAEEFRTLASLRHPNIVSVLDYGFDDQQFPYFTMNLIQEGETLLEAVEDLSIDEKLGLVIQILQALAYLHRRGVIHCDLKPSNIMVVDGIVKLLDFGLATAQGETTARSETPVGTLKYIAPERLKQEPPTEAADLWAVGVITYELLTRKYPFDDTNANTLLEDILHRQPVFPEMGDQALVNILQRLLAKDPLDRYQNVSDVLRDLSQATHIAIPESDLVRDSFLQSAKFVGRAEELLALQSALAQALHSQGTVMLVGGESGVGKSRLLHELRTFALVGGARVVRGQGLANGGLTFQIWRDVLPALLLDIEVSDLEAGILRDIFPTIEEFLGRKLPAVPELSGTEGQQRLVLTIQAILQRQSQPILLILEDLQWSPESILPLKQINRALSRLPVLIVGSYLPDERPDLPQELLLSPAKVLYLARLDNTAIAELSESMLGKVGLEPSILAMMTRETEGNLFFMVEVARALAEEAGNIATLNAENMSLPDKVFTGGMAELLQRRLTHMLPEDRPLLVLAAVAGRQLDRTLLAHLMPKVNLEAWLTRGQEAGVFEVRDNVWEFSHDKLREAVLRDLPNVAELHQQVAEAIEFLYDIDDYAEVLMGHWRAVGNPTKELRYLLIVAEGMVEFSALYEPARGLLERAISEGQPMTHQMLRLLGICYERTGKYDQALDYYQKSLDKTPINDISQKIDVLNRLAFTEYLRGQYPPAYEYAQKAHRLAQQEGYVKGIAAALNNLGTIARRQENFAQARLHHNQALNIQRAMNDQRGIASSLGSLGLLEWMQKNYEQARPYYEEALAIQRTIGDQFGITGLLTNLGEVARYQGRSDDAKKYYEEARAIQTAIGHQRGLALSSLNLAALQLQNKDDSVKSMINETLAVTQELNIPPYILAALIRVAWWHLNQGHHKHAAEWLGFIFEHPACLPEIKQDANPVLEGLQAIMSQSEIDVAMARGIGHTLEESIAQAFKELEG